MTADAPARVGVPSDEQVERLSVAVDSAFAERDRLWERYRATGRDEDERAMLRQDERAARLLDRYNAAVAAQMAEVERRRAENIARLQAERDEQWMSGRDAARPPLPPPPTAKPYTPPERKRRGRWFDEKPITTTTNAGGSGMASIEDVRAGIMAANESANEGLGAIQQAHASLETAQAALMRATEGSGQADVSDALGMLAQSIAALEEARQMVPAVISSNEGVAGRL